MKKNQDTFRRNILVLTLAAVYFFTATTHIFFIPCMTQFGQQIPTPSGNSIFKRKLENMSVAGSHLSLIQRPDKSIFEERKAVSESIKSFLNFFTLLLFIPLVWKLKPKFFVDVSVDLYRPIHSYLSLCVIRI